MLFASLATHLDESPEEAVASLRRQRMFRLVLVLLAIFGALGIAFGASLLMYADEPTVPPAQETP